MKGYKPADPREAYDNFGLSTEAPWCWACGAGSTERPDFWGGPFLIERAHIVSAPRVEDRRVVILLCSICHKLTHGLNLAGVTLPPFGLEVMLFLKMRFDPEYYDRAFMERHKVGKLPKAAQDVPGPYRRRYLDRRLYYPWQNISVNYGHTKKADGNSGGAKKAPKRSKGQR